MYTQFHVRSGVKSNHLFKQKGNIEVHLRRAQGRINQTKKNTHTQTWLRIFIQVIAAFVLILQ